MLLGTIFKFGADQYLLKSEYIEQDLLKSNALFICLFVVSFLALWTFLGFNNAARISICAAFKYYLDIYSILNEKNGKVYKAIFINNFVVNIFLFSTVFYSSLGHKNILYISFSYAVLFLRRQYFSFEFKFIKSYLVGCLPIFGIYIIPFLTRNLDLILFQDYLGPKALSDIAIMTKLSSFIILIGTSSAAVFSSGMNNSNILSYNRNVTLLVGLFAILTCSFLLVFDVQIKSILGILTDDYYIPYIACAFIISLTGTTGYAMVKTENASFLLFLDAMVLILSFGFLLIVKIPKYFIMIQGLLLSVRLLSMHYKLNTSSI